MRDALGFEFTFSSPPARVVSLVPSLTETLFDLGAGEDVVGITDYCIFPPDLDRPRVGGTKNPDVDAIRRLHPDLVHMNLEENLARHADEIRAFAPVFVTEPKSVDDVLQLFQQLGTIHSREQEADNLGHSLSAARQFASRPFSFLCAIWKKPWMWCGGDTYVSNLISTAGGRNLLESESRYPIHDVSHALRLGPDLVVLPDEPYRFTDSDARSIEEQGARRVLGPFPGHLVTWHGSRTIQGLRFLREAVSGTV